MPVTRLMTPVSRFKFRSSSLGTSWEREKHFPNNNRVSKWLKLKLNISLYNNNINTSSNDRSNFQQETCPLFDSIVPPLSVPKLGLNLHSRRAAASDSDQVTQSFIRHPHVAKVNCNWHLTSWKLAQTPFEATYFFLEFPKSKAAEGVKFRPKSNASIFTWSVSSLQMMSLMSAMETSARTTKSNFMN